MEPDNIRNLKEWSPQSKLLSRIPTKLRRGFFISDLNLTCVDVVAEFVALGTNGGLVLWYNRSNGDVQKLNCEFSSNVTTIKVVSTVDYMVAAGSDTGHVSIFQIQKELPLDLQLVTPKKPIQRYTVRGLHNSPISALEWAKNGMKLFSADKQGVVVLTEFEYHTHISKSAEILNEAYEIAQMRWFKETLIISSVYRALTCTKQTNGDWKVTQIGKSDRKVLSKFGVTIKKMENGVDRIITSRPGYRFWVTDLNGNVLQTIIMKDMITRNCPEVPLINPQRCTKEIIENFGPLYLYLEIYLITYCDRTILIIHPEKMQIIAKISHLRRIYDLSVCGSEIFVLEGPTSLVRIATLPENFYCIASRMVNNPAMHRSESSALPTNGPIEHHIEFESDEEEVLNAEECFELPPIENLELKTPLHALVGEQNIPKNERLLYENSKKAEVFERINKLKFDDSILFKHGTKRKSPKSQTSAGSSNTNTDVVDEGRGIVEIGQPADRIDNDFTDNVASNKQTIEPNISISISNSVSPKDNESNKSEFMYSTQTPTTLETMLKQKEEFLAEALELPQIKLEPNAASSFSSFNTNDLYMQYPIRVDDTIANLSFDDYIGENNIAHRRKSMSDYLYFIKDDINEEKSITPEPKISEVSIPSVKPLCDIIDIPALWNVDNPLANGNKISSLNESSEEELCEEGWVVL